VLAAGKGRVLPVLAMLAAKRRLRVAARGSGPGAKQRRPCPPLRAVTARKRRDEGRPAASTPGLRPGSNKGLTRKESQVDAVLSSRGRAKDQPMPVTRSLCCGPLDIACYRSPGSGRHLTSTYHNEIR